MNAVIVAADEADGIAAAIRREQEAASAAAQSAVDHALEAGRLLAEARQGIPHGGWESFVRDRCGIAPRTARLYLQLDANRERLANRQRDAGLTVREAARLVAEPKDTIAEPVDDCDELKDVAALVSLSKPRQLTLADVDPLAAAMRELTPPRKTRGPTKASKNNRLEKRLIKLMIGIRGAVELLDENTSKKSNRRESVAKELRSLANRLCPAAGAPA